MSSDISTKKILIMAANPQGMDRLRLDKEARDIKEGLRQAREREQFTIDSEWAVRPKDIRRAILYCKPQIVHFSGHGSIDGGLAFENEMGQVKLVHPEALSGLFRLFSKHVKCVVLNACYSEIQADAIAQHIDFVIGMNKAIGDFAAIEFAVGFYDALGDGCSVEVAYEFGCNAIEMAGIQEHLTPVLRRKEDKVNTSFVDLKLLVKDEIVQKEDDRNESLVNILQGTFVESNPTKKYTVIICDDSKHERMRFYQRQYDNFQIYGVSFVNGEFQETDPIDSIEKLYKKIRELRDFGELPDLILLDLFYLRQIDNVRELEQNFINKITSFKQEFRSLKREVNAYLIAAGVDLLRKIRVEDGISSQELPISVYTDKNFNFLTAEDFNSIYSLDPGFIYKDRDDDEPRSQITPALEYFRILSIIEKSKGKSVNNSVFISYGHGNDWLTVKKYIEINLSIKTIALPQQASRGRRSIEKLYEELKQCSSALIIMTCNEQDNFGTPKAREDLMYEIGLLQGILGLNNIYILHENNISPPRDLPGIVCIPYAKGQIESVCHLLKQEICAS